MFNKSKYDPNLYSEKKCYTQENFLSDYNDHLHTTFTKFLNTNSIYFAYNNNITGHVTAQCSVM